MVRMVEQQTLQVPVELVAAPASVPVVPIPVPVAAGSGLAADAGPNVLTFQFFGLRIDSMAIVLLLLLGLIGLFFWHAHKYKDTNFNIYDLITENGRASKTGVVYIFSFILASWILAHKTLTGANIDGLWWPWMAAFTVPITASIIKGRSAKMSTPKKGKKKP